MKKLITLILVFSLIFTLAACTLKAEDMATEHMFEIVDETAGYTIYRHKETGVHYLCRDGFGKSIVVMVNADGTPYTGENDAGESK